MLPRVPGAFRCHAIRRGLIGGAADSSARGFAHHTISWQRGDDVQIIVLGAGYGGLRTVLDLHRHVGRRKGVHIRLVDKHDYHQFRTELHRTAAGTASPNDVRIPLSAILRGTSVETVKGLVTQIRPDEQIVRIGEDEELRYDRLVVALGSRPEFFNIPGLKENGLALQSLNSADRIRRHIDAQIQAAAQQGDAAARQPYLTVVVGGGGLTGVEFVAELADRLPALVERADIPREELRLITVEAAPGILRGFDQRLVEKAQGVLSRRGVEFLLSTAITGVEAGRVLLADRDAILTRSFVWTGGVRGHEVVEAALTTQARGRAVVNAYLQSVDSEAIYLIGDCALALHPKTGQPVAPTAQNAIAQGRLVARNIWAEMDGTPLSPYRAQQFGLVASLGRGTGLADVGGLPVIGIPAAILKDMITLKYLWSIGGPGLLLRRLVVERRQASPVRS